MVAKPLSPKGLNVLYLLLSVCAFAYAFIRALKLDITYDESTTLIDFVQQSVYHILNFTPCDANNHILNSLSIKFLYSFLPPTDFVARIPNLACFVIFLIYAYRLCSVFLNGATGLVAFVVLVFNPFCLDFFGLARGYGMALSFELASIYYLLRYLRDQRFRFLVYTLTWGAFSVLAVLSSLNYYLGLTGVLVIHLFLFRKTEWLRPFLTGLFITAALTLILWEPVRKLMKENSLYYGGKRGFYEDTLISLAKYTMYTMKNADLVGILLNFFLYIFAFTFVSALFNPRSKQNLFMLSGILAISSVSVILQHHILGTLYVIDRTALFLYPLLILTLFLSATFFTKKWLSTTVLTILGLAFFFNFLLHANLYKTITWYFDSHTTEILDVIKKDNGSRPIAKIDYSWPFESGMRHYRREERYRNIEVIKRGYLELDTNFNYYVYLGGTLDKFTYEPEKQYIVGRDVDTLLSFEDEKVYLFKNKNDLP